MVLLATLFILHGVSLVGSMPGFTAPENITVMFLSPNSVRVSWSTSPGYVDKYDVTFKPTDASYRVVDVVAGNSEEVTLNNLTADTQYQITVTAVRSGKKYRSRPVVFRTMEPPQSSPQQGSSTGSTTSPSELPPEPPDPRLPQQYSQVRGVEVGIVILVLIVWAGAIALFFNRWGKIRMLLPYQPDYKEQLKVPGTTCPNGGVACSGQPHGAGPACPQGCCFVGQCFKFLPRTRTTAPVSHPADRDCGCQFALLHRADT